MIDTALSVALVVLAWLGVALVLGVLFFVGTACAVGVREAKRAIESDRDARDS